MKTNPSMLAEEGITPRQGGDYSLDDVKAFKAAWFVEADWKSSTYQHTNNETKATGAYMMIKFKFHFLDICTNWTIDNWTLPQVALEDVFPPGPAWLPAVSVDGPRTMWRNMFWLRNGYEQPSERMLHLPYTSKEWEDEDTNFECWYAVLDTEHGTLVFNGQTLQGTEEKIVWTVLSIGHAQGSNENYKIIVAKPRDGEKKKLHDCKVSEMKMASVSWENYGENDCVSMTRESVSIVNNKKGLAEAIMAVLKKHK